MEFFGGDAALGRRRQEQSEVRCALPHCGGWKLVDFKPPGVCAVCRVALPSSVCALACKGGEDSDIPIGRSQI